jgi:fatty-acyl-CoA synthase
MSTLRNITIDQALREAVEKYPDNKAIVYGDECYTYREFDEAVTRMASGLIDCGAKKGDRVGVWCDTSPKAIIAMFACFRAGFVLTMFNTSLLHQEMMELMNAIDIKQLIIGEGYKNVDFIKESELFYDNVPALQNILYIGNDLTRREYKNIARYRGTADDLVSEFSEKVTPEDDACILFTSGTTHTARPVVTSNYSRVNSALLQGEDIKTTENDVFCITMPIFHCFSLNVNIMAPLFYGACICIPKSRHTGDVIEAVVKHKCTVMSSVPSFYHALIVKQDLSKFDISSLRVGFIGGSACPPGLFKEIEEVLGFTLLSSLGQTEATAGITVANLDDSLEERATTLGHFMDYIQYKFTDEGEICIKGYNVMKGYFNDPEATANAIDSEGWLHTGDTGYLNENGNLVYTGRCKEIIIRGGENISPMEIEKIMADDGRIRAVKAIGVPDRHYGEEIALCVVKEEGASITENDIRAIYRMKLADFKNPKYIYFFNELPENEFGKVNIEELRKETAYKLGDYRE